MVVAEEEAAEEVEEAWHTVELHAVAAGRFREARRGRFHVHRLDRSAAALPGPYLAATLVRFRVPRRDRLRDHRLAPRRAGLKAAAPVRFVRQVGRQ